MVQVSTCFHQHIQTLTYISLSASNTSLVLVCLQKACSGVEVSEDDNLLAKVGVDVDFAFELETFKFRTPTVRFSYDVSPPPPPPLEIEAYQVSKLCVTLNLILHAHTQLTLCKLAFLQ